MSELVVKRAGSCCVLVLGMHRSGTSATTRCLNLVGMDVGSNLLDPDSANAKGYWEHADVVRINDQLLAAFDMAWWSLQPLPEGWMQSDPAARARGEIEALVRRDFRQVPLWGIKDPRLCRLAPLWIECLEGMGISVVAVFTLRSSAEVSRSLVRAQGLEQGAGILSWILHLAESERATRQVVRTMIGYDQLLADPVATLEKIGRELGVSWPVPPPLRKDALESFLDAGLRTQRPSSPSLDWTPPITSQMESASTRIAERGGVEDWAKLAKLSDEAMDLVRLLEYRRRSPLPDELAVRANGTTEDIHASLYHAAEDEEFSESRVSHQPVPAGRTLIEFPLRGGPGVRYRLDPASRNGYYIFHGLMVRDAQRRLLWSWDEHPAQVKVSGIYSLESPGERDAVVHRADDDPHMLLCWPEGTVQAGSVLVLDIERFDVQRINREFDALERQFGALVRKLKDARQQSSEREHHLEQELIRVERERHAFEGTVQSLGRQFEQQARQVEQLGTSLASLQESAAHQQAALQALLRRDIASRLRRRFGTMRFQLQPCQQLEPGGDANRYRVTGNDPIFVCGNNNYPLAPGWYLADLDMVQHEGVPAQPMLYPDYGPGMPPDLRGIRLKFVDPRRRRHRGLVRFPFPVFGLRFDPAMAPCELSVGALSLRRISKVRAGLELLRTLRAAPKAARASSLSWGDLARRVADSGVSGTASWVYGRSVSPDDRLTSYETWLADYDRFTEEDRRRAVEESSRWEYQPLVSILVPTYNTDEAWLRRCIESVLAQAYERWELCIADDASPQAHVTRVIGEYVARDKRIRLVRRDRNGHISASSNSALAIATGEYVALLDHDDELHPLALHEVVRALQLHREWKLIFTDEDKIDQNGRRYDPYFKPDWNYDLFLGQNCVSHLGIYQRALVREIGGFREGFEGSQDWDLALRFVERLSSCEIGHVPRVLYHWRAIPGSTSVGVGEKNYARSAGLRAIQEHLDRIRPGATVEEIPDRPGNFRVSYPVDSRPRVSLIIPTRDGLDLLRRCVESILRLTTYDNYEIVIVDNQSSQAETLEYFRTVSEDNPGRVRVLAYDQPFNYSAINNFAISHTQGDLVGLVNNDIEVITPGWIEEMAAHAMREEVGAVGALLYYPDDTIQHAGVIVGMHGVAAHAYCGEPRGSNGQMGRARLTQSLSAVTAACLMVRRSVYEQVGGLDEKLRVAFNDVDFCLRIGKAGYRNVWTPFAELYHHESATRGKEDSPEKLERFAGEVRYMLAAWGPELQADPAYNPNLSLVDAPFALAFPPRKARWVPCGRG